jgi:amino acid transporter
MIGEPATSSGVASEEAGGPARLRRVLGSWGTAALSIGVMAPTLAMAVVGPEAARLVGRAAPLAFVLAALLVLLVSVGFVRLSAEFASAGSVYAFVGGSIGPRAGAFTGVVMLGTYLVFPWVSVAGVTLFGTELLRMAGLDVDWLVVALVGWLVVGGLAASGLRPAVRALIAFEVVAVLVILGLMAVVVRALASGTAPRGQRFDAGVFVLPAGLPTGALVLAGVAAFLAFCGFESAGSLGEEAHRPRTAVPRAMLVAIGVGAVFYVVCVTVQAWGFGTDDPGVAAFAGSTAPLGALAAAYVGPWLAAVLHAMALISAIGAGLGCVLVAVRLLFAFGRDGRLPTALARISRRNGAPTVALVVELSVGIITIVGFRLAVVPPDRMFFVLATFGVLTLLVMYAVTDLAALRHLRRTGAAWPVLPLFGAVVAVAVLVQSAASVPPGLLIALAGWLALAAVFALARARPAAGADATAASGGH